MRVTDDKNQFNGGRVPLESIGLHSTAVNLSYQKQNLPHWVSLHTTQPRFAVLKKINVEKTMLHHKLSFSVSVLFAIIQYCLQKALVLIP